MIDKNSISDDYERLAARDWACVAVITVSTVIFWIVGIAWMISVFRGWE